MLKILFLIYLSLNFNINCNRNENLKFDNLIVFNNISEIKYNILSFNNNSLIDDDENDSDAGTYSIDEEYYNE